MIHVVILLGIVAKNEHMLPTPFPFTCIIHKHVPAAFTGRFRDGLSPPDAAAGATSCPTTSSLPGSGLAFTTASGCGCGSSGSVSCGSCCRRTSVTSSWRARSRAATSHSPDSAALSVRMLGRFFFLVGPLVAAVAVGWGVYCRWTRKKRVRMLDQINRGRRRQSTHHIIIPERNHPLPANVPCACPLASSAAFRFAPTASPFLGGMAP